MANFIFIPLILLIILSSSMANYASFYNALEVIAASGYLSMALTLKITSKSLHLEETSGTIFAASDPAFVHSGQPSLLQLLYHVTPTRLSLENLKSLPLGTRIPTLLPNQPLIITSGPDSRLSINGLLVQESPLVDDGFIIVYGITDFLNFSSVNFPPNVSKPPSSNHVLGSNNVSPAFGDFDDVTPFSKAKELLESRGYSIMAAFLDAQIFGFRDRSKLTIFAPDDEAMEAGGMSNVTDLALMFRQHVVPGLLSWRDLAGLKDGTGLQTFSGEFTINVTKSGDVLILNGVPLVLADLYYSSNFIVHGLNRLLVSEIKQEVVGVGDAFSDFTWEGGQIMPDYGGEYAEDGAR